MLRCVTYISNSELPCESTDGCVSSIVQRSVEKNSSLGLTGALLFTGRHFVQTLEGDAYALGNLMRDIARDERHSSLRLLRDTNPEVRRFSKWSLAYAGPSQFVDRHVRRLIRQRDEATQDELCGWLEMVMLDVDQSNFLAREKAAKANSSRLGQRAC
jgi:hypothetical protein